MIQKKTGEIPGSILSEINYKIHMRVESNNSFFSWTGML